jgi:hypothetical protein
MFARQSIAAIRHPKSSLTPAHVGSLQRKCACGGTPGPTGECEACRKKKLQRKSKNGRSETQRDPEVPPIVHEVLRSPGQPLDASMRAFFESRFGHDFRNVKLRHTIANDTQGNLTLNDPHDADEEEANQVAERVSRSIEPQVASSPREYDFSHVRIHTDGRAAASARAVNALAYVVGKHIVFGAGTYSGHTFPGRRLLAHELTHVVQQNRAGMSISRLQRFVLRDCDAAAGEINPRAATAKARIDASLAALAVRPLSDETRSALLIAFRDASDETLSNVQGHLSLVSSGWDALELRCERLGTSGYSGCIDMSGTAAGGFTEAHPPYAVHLCEPQWRALPSTDAKENVLLHEASHHFGRRGPEAYYTEGCVDNADINALDTSSRLQNADSFACFVWLRSQPLEWLRARLGRAMGAQLSILQTPAGPVDYLSDQRVPMFQLQGEPPPGAQLRWLVRDEVGRSYTMWCDTANRSASEPGSCRAAYIHASTRSILRAREVRNAWVECTVVLSTGQVLSSVQRRFSFHFNAATSQEIPPTEAPDSQDIQEDLNR